MEYATPMMSPNREVRALESQSRATPPGGVRIIDEPTGASWLVREVEYACAEGPSRSLIFMSQGELRRIRNYPPEWVEWTDVDLMRLADAR
jgi:hypothetical protein